MARAALITWGGAKDEDRCAFPVVLSRCGQAVDGVANGIGERGHGEGEVLTHPMSFKCEPRRVRSGEVTASDCCGEDHLGEVGSEPAEDELETLLVVCGDHTDEPDALVIGRQQGACDVDVVG